MKKFVWLSATLTLLIVLAAGLTGRKRFPQAGRLSLLFLTAALLPLPPALFRYQAWQDGVVISSKAQLLLSPFAEAEPVSILKEGSMIRPLAKEHGAYSLVRDMSGHKGWLNKSSFEQIAALPQ